MIGNAYSNYGNAQQQFMKNRISNITGNSIGGVDAALEDAVKSIFSGGFGG